MYHEDAKQILAYIRSLWSEWTPNFEQAEEWCRKLNQFDEDVVKQAIDAYREERAGNFKKPNLYELAIHCKKVNPAQAEYNKPFVPEVGVLYGAEAKRKAYMIILDGPDTAGRRWLRRHLGIDVPLPKNEDKLNFG